MIGGRALAGGMLVAALLGGCAPPTAGTEGSTSSASPEVSSVAPERLAAQKAKAGIADCPVSDPSVAAVADGLPDLVLDCLGGGRPVRLAGLRGQPTMINIWAQWCEPCRAESRYLAEIAREQGDELRIIGIDYDDPRPDWAIEFADLVSWRYPQLQDVEAKVRAPLQIAGPPQTLLVDARGRITYRHPGPFASTEEIREVLAGHLGVGS